MKCLSLSALLLVGFLPAGGSAQEVPVVGRASFWYHHASTAQEGVLRGMADYISARGENEVNRASAGYIRQQAQGLAIRNDVASVNAYWLKKLIREVNRYGNRSRRATQAAHQPKQQERLASYLLSPSGSAVRWPGLLLGEEYRTERAVIEHALAMRACGEYGAASLSYDYALAARERMLTTLKGQIREMSPKQYLAAKKFVNLVTQESLYSPDTKLANN